ncbi:MAG: SMP-30/gluconolactonase/LRE family protein [Ilumatobacteraceae bacterium]|nr:SMP-30/gluconolactonase/LRE family protein [Ilumatobacteraceae bacterium]
MTWTQILGGIDFGETPRWHDGRLWFSDFYQQTISSVGENGQRRIEVSYDGQPAGLGWLPDGRLLFVSMLDQRIMRVEGDGSIVEHADLADIAGGPCNDMVVGSAGNAYVGNFGSDVFNGAEPTTSTLAIVWADGAVTAATETEGLQFPNGAVITDDQSTLIIGETMGGRYTAFTITPDRRLSNRRVWAEVPGMAPDGCTIDAEGAIWFGDAAGKQVVRVVEGGEITDRLETPDSTYACMLGGSDGRTLYALSCPHAMPADAAGAGAGTLLSTRVEVPRGPSSRP